MELQVGVKVLLKNPDGKYLLIKRSPIEYPESSKWDIPGGRINVGSSLSENLAREVLEETGLTLMSEPKVIAAQDIFVPKQDRHVVRITYMGEAEGTPRLSEEHTEYQWVTVVELKAMSTDVLDRYIKALIEAGIIQEATL